MCQRMNKQATKESKKVVLKNTPFRVIIVKGKVKVQSHNSVLKKNKNR